MLESINSLLEIYDYDRDNPLISGINENIFIGKNISTKETVLIKEIFYDSDSDEVDFILYNFDLLQKVQALDSPNLISIYHFGIDKFYSCAFLVFEYSENGNLTQYFEKKKVERLPEKECLNIIFQIAIGLRDLEKLGISHGNLRPSSILYFPTKIDVFFKICDFGLTYCQNDLFAAISGNFESYPPELITLSTDPDILKSCDMWALGVLLDFLLFRRPYFGSSMQIAVRNVQNRCYKLNQKEEKSISSRTKQILSGLFERDYEKRLTLEKLFEILLTIENQNLLTYSTVEDKLKTDEDEMTNRSKASNKAQEFNFSDKPGVKLDVDIFRWKPEDYLENNKFTELGIQVLLESNPKTMKKLLFEINVDEMERFELNQKEIISICTKIKQSKFGAIKFENLAVKVIGKRYLDALLDMLGSLAHITHLHLDFEGAEEQINENLIPHVLSKSITELYLNLGQLFLTIFVSLKKYEINRGGKNSIKKVDIDQFGGKISQLQNLKFLNLSFQYSKLGLFNNYF